MNFFKKSRPQEAKPLQTVRSQSDPLPYFRRIPRCLLGKCACRGNAGIGPGHDAAIQKIIRLTGEFVVTAGNREADAALKYFRENVHVGASGLGIMSFVSAYLDQLLTYGNALGEIVPTKDGSDIAALYNASLEQVEVRAGKNPLQAEITLRGAGQAKPLRRRNSFYFRRSTRPQDKPSGFPCCGGCLLSVRYF